MAEPDESPSIPTSSTLPRRRCRIPRLSRSSSDAARPKSSGDYAWHARRLPSLDGVDLGSAAGSVPFSLDDDGSSVKSFGSFLSYASQATTEASAASRPVSRCHYGKRYIVHCERHLAKPEEYLTPTQRREREIRQLKAALAKQMRRCDEKEREVERLRDEVQALKESLAQMQDGKHNIMNSSQESDHLDSIIAKNSASEISFESHDGDRSDLQNTMILNNDDSGISNVLSMSPRHSSEFGDLEGHPAKVSTAEKAVCTDFPLLDEHESRVELNSHPLAEHSQRNFPASSFAEGGSLPEQAPASPRLSPEFEKFLCVYKQELENLKAQHREHYQDLKERFSERVDDLLEKLGEANTRYLELRPLFDRAQDKIHSIESQLGEVQKEMESQEEYHNQMYLKMYRWRNAFRACVCASVAGIALRHLTPYLWADASLASVRQYLSPTLAIANLKCLANWVEFRVM